LRLEIIHLRSTGMDAARLIAELRASVAAVPGQVQVRCYRHTTLASDLAVHLHFSKDVGEMESSELGARLASELKRYGLVEHTVWLEEPPPA